MLAWMTRVWGAIAAAIAATTRDGYARQFGDRVEEGGDR